MSQSSATSFSAKKLAIHSILVRRKATFRIPSSWAVLAPCHMRAPLMSMPMKFLLGKRRASPIVYSPRPHPSSNTMGFSFLKNSSCHFPCNGNPSFCNCQKGHSTTSGFFAISANFANFPFPILSYLYLNLTPSSCQFQLEFLFQFPQRLTLLQHHVQNLSTAISPPLLCDFTQGDGHFQRVVL